MSLPVISPEELSDSKRCFVTLKNRVYDVTQFVPDHPGGADLILNYRGKDVSEMMSDITSHEHSDSAYEMLEEYLIGILSTSKPSSLADTESTLVDSKDPKEIYATGLTCEEDLNVPTDINNDFAKHKFLDLSRPLLPQVFNGGFTKEFYLQQVHRPRHYPFGSARLMPYLWMEPFSKTPWWVIPTLWGPCVAYGTWFASQGLSLPVTILFWLTGLFLWTLVEYGLHRFLFHVDQYLPDNKYFLTLHFLLHGVHHYLPTDKLRLVLPPALFLVLAYPWYRLAHLLFPYYIAIAVFSGGIFGYIMYDMTHYFLHHESLPGYYRQLKSYHLAHHYKNFELGYGVTSRLWDVVFGTELDLGPKVKNVE